MALKLSVAMALKANATARKLTEKTLQWRKDLKQWRTRHIAMKRTKKNWLAPSTDQKNSDNCRHEDIVALELLPNTAHLIPLFTG